MATPAVAAWDEIDRGLALGSPHVAQLGAELVNGVVRPIHGFHQAKLDAYTVALTNPAPPSTSGPPPR